ncbi:hypothetical protein B0T19DRAFT_401712 [Cercophora scortea]|uniref:Uncharacterized protein n=1 Tax=Cercophora scortea TaxID=314031 RepID=A0AAE0IE08_9PEZI|nr:hypothetical protein B0T19DRAFT_401712 [Cercophora scortea]
MPTQIQYRCNRSPPAFVGFDPADFRRGIDVLTIERTRAYKIRCAKCKESSPYQTPNIPARLRAASEDERKEYWKIIVKSTTDSIPQPGGNPANSNPVWTAIQEEARKAGVNCDFNNFGGPAFNWLMNLQVVHVLEIALQGLASTRPNPSPRRQSAIQHFNSQLNNEAYEVQTTEADFRYVVEAFNRGRDKVSAVPPGATLDLPRTDDDIRSAVRRIREALTTQPKDDENDNHYWRRIKKLKPLQLECFSRMFLMEAIKVHRGEIGLPSLDWDEFDVKYEAHHTWESRFSTMVGYMKEYKAVFWDVVSKAKGKQFLAKPIKAINRLTTNKKRNAQKSEAIQRGNAMTVNSPNNPFESPALPADAYSSPNPPAGPPASNSIAKSNLLGQEDL